MIDKETGLNMTDWELSEDYYKEREGKKELKLEDFMMGEDEIPSLVSGEETDPLLAQKICAGNRPCPLPKRRICPYHSLLCPGLF